MQASNKWLLLADPEAGTLVRLFQDKCYHFRSCVEAASVYPHLTANRLKPAAGVLTGGSNICSLHELLACRIFSISCLAVRHQMP